MEAQTSTRPRASLDQTCVNTIHMLSTDAVQAAVSGHPRTPLATAPAAYSLRNEIPRSDPEGTTRHERVRFVLPTGHAPKTLDGQSIATETSGASAPPEGLAKKSGFTVGHVVEAAKVEQYRR